MIAHNIRKRRSEGCTRKDETDDYCGDSQAHGKNEEIEDYPTAEIYFKAIFMMQ